jgi:hypothetical protein
LLAVWVAGLALSLPGCGTRPPPSAPISGTVTLRGKPLPADAAAFISFTSATPGAAAVSASITRGRYECPHAPQGQVTAFFEITRPAGPPRKSDRTGELYQETQSPVPARYASGLPLTLDGPTTRDFDLVD